MTDQSKIDTYAKIATLWADHFQVTGKLRQRLIDAYVRRCQQRRFWCIQTPAADHSTVLCRLGGVMVFFDGRLLHTFKVEQKAQGKESVFDTLLRPNTPSESYAKTLQSRAKATIKKAPAPAMAVFDAMTTFARGYREMVNDELDLDLGSAVNLNHGVESRSLRYVRPRSRFYNSTGAGRFKELCALLDPEILHAIRSVHCPSMSLYNWIASGDKTRRIQAIKAYPLLMPLIILSAEKRYIDGHEEPKRPRGEDYQLEFSSLPTREPRLTSRANERLGQQVDAGESLQPIIAKEFDLPEKLIKQIAKHPRQHTGSALRHIGLDGWSRDLTPYVNATQLGNRKPIGKAAWKNWLVFHRALPHYLRSLVKDEQWPSILAGMPVLDDPRWEDINRKTLDLRDLALTREQCSTIAAWPLARALNLGDRWHEERARFVREIQQEDERNANDKDPAWKPMIKAPFSAELLEIVELNTPEQLNEEAKRLRHCVDGYSSLCYDGHSRILSIRSKGASLATMEMCLRPFKVKPGTSHLVCTQLRGHMNKGFDKGDPVNKAAEKLLRQIRGGHIEVDLVWPSVPLSHRPQRMQRRNEQIARHMNEWLENALKRQKQAKQLASAA